MWNPWKTHWALALVKGIREPHEVKKKIILTLVGIRSNPRPPDRSTVTLPTEVRGQTDLDSDHPKRTHPKLGTLRPGGGGLLYKKDGVLLRIFLVSLSVCSLHRSTARAFRMPCTKKEYDRRNMLLWNWSLLGLLGVKNNSSHAPKIGILFKISS